MPRLCPELVEWRKNSVSPQLKVAIVGFGKMGLLHSGILNLLIPGVVRAVVDKSFLLTFGASKLIKSVKFYRDLDDMLREVEPEAVYVTTPASSHYPIVKQLLNRGVCYVFVEKPPTINCQQLEGLLSAKRPRQIVMVGFQKKYALTFRHAKLLLEEDVIGEIKYVNSYIRSGDILEPTTRFDYLGRGVLLDIGIHLVDLLTWFFNVETVVKAESRNIYTRVDDVFKAGLVSKEGFTITLEASWSSPEYRVPETYIEVHGTHGVLRVTEDYVKVTTSREHPLLGNAKELVLYKPHYYQGVPPVNLADPEYTIENIHFLLSIYSKKEPPTSIESSNKTMRLVDELYWRAERAG